MWVSWFVLGLGEINVRGAPTIAELLFRPYLGVSLASAIMGLCGAQLALRRDPADRQTRPGRSARSVAAVLAWISGVAGVLTLVPGLLGGSAGPLLIVVLALSLSALSLSALPVLGALIKRSPARKRANLGGLAVLVAGTEIVLFIYAFLLTLLPRTPFVGNYVASLFIVLVIAIPASALLYVQFLWRALRSVRAALEAQACAGPQAC